MGTQRERGRTYRRNPGKTGGVDRYESLSLSNV